MREARRRICVHGHFYQPPRTNPFRGIVEREPSATPFHDWNERTTAECYRPNTAARILDAQGRIEALRDNYSDISFNFGATLLEWLAQHAPDVHDAVVAADVAGAARRDGHGPAMAQPWVHAILPLASERDRRTLVHWGVVDFEHRFGRRPEGMWLPETAVDVPTLETLADLGIAFTVLAPRQAAATRRVGHSGWHDVTGERVDTTVSYAVPLPSGRSIAAFFYDGPLARAVAFEDLLRDGDAFADRLLGALGDGHAPRLVHIATDGESYGHHHRFGEMGLAWALRRIRDDPTVHLTVYGEDLAAFPPRHEARVVGPSSWSCAHGVERWRSDCGCSTGGEPGWSQAWRTPLREALDWLRDTLVGPWEAAAGSLLADPWAARDDYVHVLRDRSPATQEAFLERHASRRLGARDVAHALGLLELQLDLLAMYTSCGWFFAEPSGIETGISLRHAGRAVRLAGQHLDVPGDLQARLVERLAPMRSNVGAGDGRTLWARHVHEAEIATHEIVAAYAVQTLFGSDDGEHRAVVYAHEIDRLEHRSLRAGRAQLVLGRVRATSVRTSEHRTMTYAALHLGDHDVLTGAHPFRDAEHRRAVDACADAFSGHGLADTVRELDRCFAGSLLSLASLPVDARTRVLDALVDRALAEVGDELTAVHHGRAALVRFLTAQDAPVPPALRFGAAVSLGDEMRTLLGARDFDPADADRLVEEARTLGLGPHELGIDRAIDAALDRWAAAVRVAPESTHDLERLAVVARLARGAVGGVGRWRAENAVVALRDEVQPSAGTDRDWAEALHRAAADLGVALPPG